MKFKENGIGAWSLGYFVAIGSVLIITAVLLPFRSQLSSTTISLVILLVVLLVATFFSSKPAFFASVFGGLSFNFFFLHPYHTFHVSDPQDWVAFGAFLFTALIAGQLSAYARRRGQEAEERRKEVEGLYVELQDAFEQSSQAEALRRSEKLKSALLDAVTHDLRTPLTSIKISATSLMEDAVALDKESRNEMLEIINEETDRLSKFIGGMVDMARIEAGKLNEQKAWREIKGIIGNAIHRAQLRLANHKIILEIGNELPAVHVDANAVEEVLYTLLENAAKYSPHGSDIRVSAKRGNNETIEVMIEDKGSGIEPGLRERVFEKFYSASVNDVHSAGSGLGLGLSIARGLAESQGGRIWVEDGSDEYITRFVFQIPIGDEDQFDAKSGDSEY